MPTITILLRLAPNVERRWISFQDALFFRCALISTRLFPPVIPVATLATGLHNLESTLEKIRRTCPLKLLSGGGASAARRGEGFPERGPIRYTVSVDGFTSLRDDLVSLLEPVISKEESPAIVLAWEQRELLSSERKRCTEQVLGEEQVPTIPATRAFWLSAVELERGPDPLAWWEAATWKELYCRRITVLDEAPLKTRNSPGKR